MQKLVLSLESNDVSPSFTVLILSKCVNVETCLVQRDFVLFGYSGFAKKISMYDSR